jgi:hypothetical protein
MRKNEIKVGKTYTDGKGGTRTIVASGRLTRYSLHQIDRDCIEYRMDATKKCPGRVGSTYTITRSKFAQWAKEEVKL